VLPTEKRVIMVSGRKFHVLVVDNGEDMVITTTAMLEQLGYSAQGETESLAGLRTFSQDPDKFDLAIVEPAMPGQKGPELAILGSMRRGSPVTSELTGLELAVRFRRIRPGIPILLYTGPVKQSLAAEIRAAGFGKAILKPLGLKGLGKAVREGLHT
jgi:two-component system, cell cycle sensor histidine kinase and response regulator CckA